jgi:hypothetical protein
LAGFVAREDRMITLKLGGAGECLVEKHGMSRRRSWRKLHVGIDANNGEIVAVGVTKKEVRWLTRISTRLPIPSLPSPPTAITIRTGSARRLRSAIRTLLSSSRHDRAVASASAETAPTQRDRQLRMIAERSRMALAESQRLQSMGQGRGVDRPIQPIQARYRRCRPLAQIRPRQQRSPSLAQR